MALTKISRSLLDTGVSDSSDATAITIDSSENVGINTTSPNEKLEVAGNLTLTPSSKSNSPSASATISDINFVGRTDNTVVAKIRAIHNDNANGTDGQLIFFTADNTASAAAAEKMRITSAGKIGVGTTSPNGVLNVQSTSSTAIKILQDSTSAAFTIQQNFWK